MDEFATGFVSLSLQDQVLPDFGGDARKGVTVAAAASSSTSSLSSTSSSLSSTSSSSCCAICLEKIELQEITNTRLYALEESVCLLLRANWFEPPPIVAREEVTDEHEEYYYPYEEDDDDGMDDFYLGGSSTSVLATGRWGSNGYVRT
ncbi:hypothetical protein Scep_013897 [Stephania cephalantha]|uniref:Uncharacterized protein n=1 Tax=Stephania cephalantha TaxID=152367 RepID=A0AAP0P2G8_9MAGN